MYVRVRVNSAYTETQLDWTEVITCPRCQAKWKGQVFARAHGRGKTYNAYAAPDDNGALEAAGIDAFANAVDTGKAMLRRARCLRCRKRMGAVDSLVIKTVFAYGVIAGVVIFTARMLARTDVWRGGGSVLVPLLAIPLASVLIWLTVNRELAKSDQRVQLGPVGEIGAHPAMRLEDPEPEPEPEPAEEEPEPAPPSRAAARRPAGPPDPDGLELDFDRSWNKKKG